jgi:cytochrome c biogenesis protein CcmG/thiol:disulfide interchange protein DsbE
MSAGSAPRPAVRLATVILWSVVGLVLLGLALMLVRSFATQPQSGKAPDFSLGTYDGKTISLASLRGQVVLVNFWASWCAPCAEEAPALERVWQTYKDRGVTFVGVGYVDSDAAARKFIEQYGITYLNGPDLGTRISDAYAIEGVPETFIVNRQGEISFFAKRPLTEDDLTAALDKALAE